MKKWFCLALVGWVSVISSSLAVADNHAGQTTLTLGGGWYRFAADRRIDNTGIPMGALSYNLNQKFAIEALLGFFNTQSRNPVDNNSQVNGTLFALDVLYRFNQYGVLQPYVLAGPGATSMNPNGTDAHTEGNVNVGLGTQIFIDKMVAFRVEARDFYTIVGGKNDLYLDGGVSFLLG